MVSTSTGGRPPSFLTKNKGFRVCLMGYDRKKGRGGKAGSGWVRGDIRRVDASDGKRFSRPS